MKSIGAVIAISLAVISGVTVAADREGALSQIARGIESTQNVDCPRITRFHRAPLKDGGFVYSVRCEGGADFSIVWHGGNDEPKIMPCSVLRLLGTDCEWE
jgi:hypothetical protein